jgi:hypothetical protein
MKRILAALLAVVMIVGCMLTMTSCSLSIFDPKPQTDLEKAKENLEENDYLVIVKENSEETPLEIGVEAMLVAYDLIPFIEKMQEEDEEFNINDLKEELGDEFAETVVAMIGEEPVLTITIYEDKKLAGFAYDNYKLMKEAEEAVEKAAEKDAKKYGPVYYADKEEDKYQEKYDKQMYEYAKYMLEEFARDLEKEENLAEKEYYESIVEEYEKADEDMLFGKKGTAFWYGTKQAIKDSK